MPIQDILRAGSLKKQFISKYCNNRGIKTRWLRGAFWDEQEKIQTVLEYLQVADSRLIEVLEQLFKVTENMNNSALVGSQERFIYNLLKNDMYFLITNYIDEIKR